MSIQVLRIAMGVYGSAQISVMMGWGCQIWTYKALRNTWMAPTYVDMKPEQSLDWP